MSNHLLSEESKQNVRDFVNDNCTNFKADEATAIGMAHGMLVAYVSETWYLLVTGDDGTGNEKSVVIVSVAQLMDNLGPTLAHIESTEGLASLKMGSEVEFEIVREDTNPDGNNTVN